MMSSTERVEPSSFVWYELMTTDAQGAANFYQSVVGWGIEPQEGGIPGLPYTLLTVGKRHVGGLLTMAKEVSARGSKPVWIGYIGVNDVDEFTRRVKAAGGSVHRAPEDIPSVGRFSVVADPQGAAFVLFQAKEGSSNEPLAAATPGSFGWHELHAVEWESAFAFYSELFGWTKAEAVDMGSQGIYQTFAAGGFPIGGTMTAVDKERGVVGWLYYVNVAEIGPVVERVKEHGGQIVVGPHQVPGGSWIVQAIDPQGGLFAVVAPK